MKKIISLVLVIIMLFCSSISAFSAEKTTSETKVGGSGIGHQEEIISTVLQEHWAFIGWHPEVDAPEYGLSGWSFSYTKASFTFSLGASYNFASVSLSVNRGVDEVGKHYECLMRKWSRPAVYADIYLQTYKSGLYNFNTNTWVNYTINTRTIANNSIIRIEESYNRSDLL